MTLNKLGVVKVNADDIAEAVLIVAANGQRDTGTVASARAAEIYGLDILAESSRKEKIQHAPACVAYAKYADYGNRKM